MRTLALEDKSRMSLFHSRAFHGREREVARVMGRSLGKAGYHDWCSAQSVK